jgi:ABC-2 type transport system permease protein
VTGTTIGESPALIGVRDASGSVSDNLRAVSVVWRRELIRFARARGRIVIALAQPAMFLLLLGTGLASAMPSQGSVDFRTFMFPGMMAMTVLFTSIFSSVTIVFDREFGFMREMLVAPVHRSSLVLGKCLGGATVATAQGALMLLFAPLVDVPLDPMMMVLLVLQLALMAFSLTALGIAIACRMTKMESFQTVMQFVVMPLFFLSGAMFPLTSLPTWLNALTKLNPLSYAVDPLRRTVFSRLDLDPGLVASMNPGITWNGWRVPTVLELGTIAVLGAGLLAFAMVRFGRTE